MNLPVKISRLLKVVLGHVGHLQQSVRVAAADRAAATSGGQRDAQVVPEALQPYIDKVTLPPTKSLTAISQRLKRAGFRKTRFSN